ncbi:MAG: glycosyltransferase family 2 protein [Sphingobacteriales bacterium]|nr:MAG: glycosyltransferase family 2 protein [Sphingobacteriales bacterium]
MFQRFILPRWVVLHDRQGISRQQLIDTKISLIPLELKSVIDGLKQFKQENPLVSIIIPAYNEEADLLKTLSSLSKLKPKYPTELIVANNNSTDGTQDILDFCGVSSVFEKRQGISYARQAGLEAAKGKYILSADADSIYPDNWGNRFVDTLIKNKDIACVYGRYSFIPHNRSQLTRIGLAIHEILAEAAFSLRRKENECVNVMGFNFAYRREDGLKVGGFKHDLNRKVTQRSEDGWMALELSSLGKVKLVKTNKRVWTSDRRLLTDGSLLSAFTKRIVRYARNYFQPPILAESSK